MPNITRGGDMAGVLRYLIGARRAKKPASPGRTPSRIWSPARRR